MEIQSYSWLQEKFPALTAEEAAVVEWQYGYCGGFRSALWELICRADVANLEKIGRGFPVEVLGYRFYTGVSGWWDKIRAKITT